MKLSLIVASVSLASSAAFAEVSSLKLVCSGKTASGSKVGFMLSQDAPGAMSATIYARKQRSGIGVIPPYIPRWIAVEGCIGAQLSGLKNGKLVSSLKQDLYVECEADGDYGWMILNKKGSGVYNGSIQSQDGIPALGIKGDEEVKVRCSR